MVIFNLLDEDKTFRQQRWRLQQGIHDRQNAVNASAGDSWPHKITPRFDAERFLVTISRVV